MANLGSLWYTMGIKDLTGEDFDRINKKLKDAGATITLTPEIFKNTTQDAVPKGVKIELDPHITEERLTKAAENKAMKVAIIPLLTELRKTLKEETKANPLEAEIGVQATKLRSLVEQVLNKHGFMITISTVNDNYTKVVQQKLDGRTYTVKIHADAKEITQSVQASLMQMQSRTFGLQVTKEKLWQSIDDALKGKRFPISVYVKTEDARNAIQTALNSANGMGAKDALNYQRMMRAEAAAAAAELNRAKAAHIGAADAAKTHATASVNLGGAMGRNITIAGELGSAMASLYSIHAAKQFLSQVIEIGGKLEHQKIALETIYGSGSKMESLYGQIKGLARQSPFGVMELTKNVKQLSAYGVAYNEVYDTAKRLADISAATSVDIQRLILAFGKTKNRTFLDGLEAKQFAYANIPIYDMLSKKLTELEGKFVSVKDVMGRIKKKEIGFDMVKEILWDMTDEGGKFYNMQEKLAGSVKTSWKLVKDNIELMFGEIAESFVGSGLKSVAEVLQGLTREWKTLGTAVLAGAAALGIYKVAVLASNTILGQHNVTSIKSIQTENAKQVQLAKTASLYRTLTHAEADALGVESALNRVHKVSILTRKQLSSADLMQLYGNNALTRDTLLRLAATGRLQKGTLALMRQTELLTYADMRYLVQLRQTNSFMGFHGKTASMLAIRFKLLGNSIKNALAPIGAMLANPMTWVMAAVSAGVALWQKNNEEMQKAKEIGDSIFNKASDGADNLKKSLEDIKPAEGLSDLELNQGIENMIQTIKDYSPTPLKDINDALVAQDGHLLTIQERYEALRKKVEDLNSAYSTAEKDNFGGIIENAIKYSDEGWFNDDINTNLKDYTNALKRREEKIREYAIEHKKSMREIVDAAIEADAGFKIAVQGMDSYEAKFKELIENSSKYGNGYIASGAGKLELGNVSQIQAAYKEVISDYNKFTASIKVSLKSANIDINNMSQETKGALALSFKSWLDGLEGVSDDVKKMLAKMLQKSFNVSLIEDDLTPQWVKAFQKLAKSSTDETVKTAYLNLQTKGYNQLSKAEKEIIDKLIKQAGIDITEQQPDLKKQVQSWFDSEPLMWQVKLQVQEAAQEWIEPLARELINAKGGGSGVLSSNVRDRFNKWAKAGSAYEMRNAAQQDLQNAENELKAAKTFGETAERYLKAKKELEEVKSALKFAKWEDLETKDQKSNKHSGSKSQKDAVAENLMQRFKDIKDAWSEFQKWSKVEGRETAANRIGESGLFSTLPKDKIPKTVEEYRKLVANLEKELKAAGIAGHSQRESLLNDILKQLLDIDKTVVDEQLKLTLDKVSKEAERQLADWNLFDKIRKATGNTDMAMSIAFGLNADAETDYPTMVKNQFNEIAKAAKSTLTFDTATPKLLKDAPDEVAKAWEKANSDIIKYFDQQRESITGILNEYQTLQDKIDAINAKRKNDLDIVNAKNEKGEYNIPDDVKRKQLENQINTKADYDIFTQSGDYLRFFNDIYGLTMTEANRIGDLIQLNLNQKLQAGLITIYDYEKEMEKVRKQLESLRNVKSNAMTFLTGGLKGLNEKKLQKEQGRLANDEGYQNALKEQIAAQNALNEAKEKGNEEEIAAAEEQLKLANQSVKAFTKIRDSIIKDQEKMQNVVDVTSIVSNIANGMADAFNTVRDLADSFGFDTDSNAWNTVGAVMDTMTTITGGMSKMAQSLMSGDIGGVISGAFDTLLTPITIWNKLHDKKLQKDIERSQKQQAGYERMINAIERRMVNFLGNPKYSGEFANASSFSGGAYGAERDLMQKQLAEMERQKADMEAMKKKDPEAIADLEDQIDEMRVKIREFAMETIKDLYGIDLKDWASQLGDALFEAWQKGEDGAEAFKKKAGDILGDMMNQILKIGLLEPMMEDVSEYLFGKDGKSGAFGSDFELTPNEVDGLAEKIMKGMEGVDAYNSALDELEKVLNDKYGLSMKGDSDSSKSGMTAGLQALTEDTGDLIASYVNGMRGDLSVIRGNWEVILAAVPQMNIVAEAQLTAQRQIAENTLRNAIAAETIVKYSKSIDDRLRRAQADKSTGFYFK